MDEAVVTQSFVVSLKQGLHLRPAERLATLASRYDSQIGLIYQDQRVDAKSIMELLTLGAAEGAHIVVEARGADAQEAVDAIMALVANDFAVEENCGPNGHDSTSQNFG